MDRIPAWITSRAKGLWEHKKHHAKRRGLEFDLTTGWFRDRLLRGKCEVSGAPFEFSGPSKRPWGPSVDRIDPKRGYTQDNCRMVAWIYNAAKGIGTDADVHRLAVLLAVGEEP